MTELLLPAGGWLLHVTLGGGLLLLLGGLLLAACREPALRQRVGAWTVAAALLLAGLSLFPAWLTVPVGPAAPEPAPAPTASEPAPAAVAQAPSAPEPPAPPAMSESVESLAPAVVLPVGLADSADRDTLKWVFAHELTHLARGDSWTALGLWLGEVVYYHLPWFWWLRRQVRLCQEYVADAAAVGAGERAADYAEFLVGLSGAAAAPHGSTGVRGTTSDLMRRVTMLLKNPIQALPRRARWRARLAAAALVVTAVGAAGVGLRAGTAAPADPPPAPKKPVAAQDEPKKE